MGKTLIAYGSRYGATKETSHYIAKILREDYSLDVDVTDLKENPEIDHTSYSNIIIASGIKLGLWTKESLNFMKNDFSDKKLAIFISSGFAGEEEKYEQAVSDFLNKEIAEYPHLKPIAQEAFGGKIPKWNIFGLIFKIQRKKLDSRDWEKIKKWSKEVGNKFSE
ncbi:MAG: hypothetical protein KAS95_01445 [Candidatus Heimdallarchaeota archaeon]|nr:hypothetical protein [Candidatus Heimdallarchaeota archaeon]